MWLEPHKPLFVTIFKVHQYVTTPYSWMLSHCWVGRVLAPHQLMDPELFALCCEHCCHRRSSKGFGGHRFLFLSAVDLGPDWLGPMVTLCLPFFLVELLGCFSKQMHILHPHQQSTTSQLLCVRTSRPLISPVFVVSASNGDGDHLFMCLWAFVCLWVNA